MNEHPSFGSAHGAVGQAGLTNPNFNGCTPSCAGTACAASNPDIDDTATIYYCERNDETNTALDYPRCAPSCTTAGRAFQRATLSLFSERPLPQRRIVLVSDMLQNSDVFSVYGRRRGRFEQRVPPARAVADIIRETYGDSLRGTELEIRLIPRETWEAEQRGELQAYWSEIFQQLGVRAYWLDI